MATAQPPQARPSWLEDLARDRRRTSYGLFAVAAILAVIPLWLVIKFGTAYLDTAIVTVFLALVPAGAGFWFFLRNSEEFSDLDAARMLVLTVGGLWGLGLVLLSASLTYHWWQYITGGMKVLQGREGWRVWAAIVCLLAGLALMFVSVQLGRAEERSNPTLRRLVYGYNAVLNGILVLAILAVVNVLAGIYFSTPYDWTTRGMYSLSTRSESILENLKKPVTVYVILGLDSDTRDRVRALLDNCRDITDKLDVQYLSPDLNRDKIKSLAEKYKVSDREGVLVVYGTPPNEEAQFINSQTLFTGSGPSFMQQNRDAPLFKGEAEIMTAISFLSEGRQKPIIYFTQETADELKLSDSGARELNTGMGVLRRKLDGDNYTVKGLRLSQIEGAKSSEPDVVVSTQVPKDASLVVVAGPKQPVPKFAADALRNYLEPAAKDAEKGKLIVLLDLALTKDRDKVEKTGLEELFEKYNVEIGDNRVMHYGRMPQLVRALLNPAPDIASRNPLPAAFGRQAFQFFDTRTVQPKTGGKGGDVNYRADSLLLVPARDEIWAETDLRKERFAPDEIRTKLSDKPLSIAVTVSEQAPSDPHAPSQGEDKPRMVIIGSVTTVSNTALNPGGEAVFGPQYDLFTSLVGWLREKPANIGIEAKKQDVYELNTASVSFNRMLYLPALLMFVGVVGVGTGVWVTRRR